MDFNQGTTAPRAIARGRWHPAGSSRSEPAVLALHDRTLAVTVDGRTGGPVSFGGLSSVNISDRIGRIPRRISFSDGALFETDDNDAIDRLLAGRGINRTGWIHEIERFHPRLIVMVIAVIALAGAIYRYALPAMVEVAVLATPPAITTMISSGSLSSLDRTVFSESKLPPAQRDAIMAKFKAMTAHARRGPDGYNLNFRDGGAIGPNAFALPDGTLVLTDQLVELAGQDTDAVLGVLAHEIGHVDKEHSLRQIYRSVGTAGLIMLVAGDIGSAGQDILTNGAALLALSYSRADESEADRISVELMAKAGHDPVAIARFFKLIQEKLHGDGDSSILSSHPGTADRQRQVEDWAKALK